MKRRYYSSRNNPRSLNLEELYFKLKTLFNIFSDKDYFRESAGIASDGDIPASFENEAALALTFQPFPLHRWEQKDITEDHIFDTIEFLYDNVSKPGEWTNLVTVTGYRYSGYDGYDKNAGQAEFRETVNMFLCDYKDGFELTKDGNILALGKEGLQFILDAEIVPYDEQNIDCKVRNAISKWRNRKLSVAEKKEAIRELADVFEWLKKNRDLSKVLDRKDESDIFEIANQFSIRHHNPKQKANYDTTIWYSWIFHFYLATYHAVIRLLLKKEGMQESLT